MKVTLLKTYTGFQVSPDFQAWFESLPVGSEIEVDYKHDRRRTSQQNKALHLWLEMLAERMNAQGVGVKALMKAKSLDVPMSMELCKEMLWRPVQEAMFGIESTADMNTGDYNRVYTVLCQQLGEKMGLVVPPWPDRFGNAD